MLTCAAAAAAAVKCRKVSKTATSCGVSSQSHPATTIDDDERLSHKSLGLSAYYVRH